MKDIDELLMTDEKRGRAGQTSLLLRATESVFGHRHISSGVAYRHYINVLRKQGAERYSHWWNIVSNLIHDRIISCPECGRRYKEAQRV